MEVVTSVTKNAMNINPSHHYVQQVQEKQNVFSILRSLWHQGLFHGSLRCLHFIAVKWEAHCSFFKAKFFLQPIKLISCILVMLFLLSMISAWRTWCMMTWWQNYVPAVHKSRSRCAPSTVLATCSVLLLASLQQVSECSFLLLLCKVLS